MLDFGMYQGNRELAKVINNTLPPVLKSIDAVILSHGHLDHCGRLPVLVRNGYHGPIYCTPATADVARVVMLDAAKIQEEDAEYLNRRSPDARAARVSPLFTADDVQSVLRLFRTVEYEKTVDLGKGVRFSFHDAGHILGSAYVILEADEPNGTRKLLFTGDIGRYGSPILKDPAPLSGPVDAVITESTYGTVQHAPIDGVAPQLLAILKDAIARGGRVILPSFAVGRTQTMLYYVQQFIRNKQIPQIPIFVDSPMGTEISRITEKYPDAYDEETRAAVCAPRPQPGQGVASSGTAADIPDDCDIFGFSKVTFTVSAEESRRINSVSGACVIIASSPTCEFGRVLHHLKRSVENPNDTVVFVGYTPTNTLGRYLQDGAGDNSRGRKLRILDRLYDLRCRVETLHGLSAHADGDELLRFLKPTLRKETTAFVVHGEEDRVDGFAARLVSAGIGQALAPATSTVAAIGQVPFTFTPRPTATDE